MGIEPLGALETVPSLVESRVWQPAITTAEGELGDVLQVAIAEAALHNQTTTLNELASKMGSRAT
jgi:hypothetical protein